MFKPTVSIWLFAALLSGATACAGNDGRQCTNNVQCEVGYDCPVGYDCNTALDPPLCHLMGCAGPSEPCPKGGDHFCWTGLKCIEPPVPSAVEGEFECWGERGQTCVNDSHCRYGAFCDNSVGECRPHEESEVPSSELAIRIYGADPTAFPNLDLFEDCLDDQTGCACSHIKLCRASTAGTLLDCSQHELAKFAEGGVDLGFSVYPGSQVHASCFTSPAEGADPKILGTGLSTPYSPENGKSINIYLLRPAEYGPTTLTPTDPASLFGPPSSPATSLWGTAAAELPDHRVLLAGGGDFAGESFSHLESVIPTGSALLYNPNDGSFEQLPTKLTEERAFAVAVSLPTGDIAVFGGLTAEGESSSAVDLFDTNSLSFVPAPDLGKTRAFHTATLINDDSGGFVLLVGGRGDGMDTWEVWNPTLGSVAMGVLNASREHHTATLVSSQDDPKARPMVFITGGQSESHEVHDTVEFFDLQQQAISASVPYLCSNDDSKATPKTMHVAVFVPLRHFIYVAGGFKDANHLNPGRDICVWQTTKEKWEGQAGAFLLDRGKGALAAAALPGNAVLFSGGLCKGPYGTLVECDTTEVVFEYLNANGETVVDIGPDDNYPISMLYPRYHHSLLPTADGKVLVVGGLTGGIDFPVAVQATEVFGL